MMTVRPRIRYEATNCHFCYYKGKYNTVKSNFAYRVNYTRFTKRLSLVYNI